MSYIYRISTVLAALFLFVFSSAVLAKKSEPDLSKTPLEFSLDEYHEKGKTGIWWIKFYSPYCHHCKAFAPTWDSIYKQLNHTYEDLNFASINCVTEGDLCDELEIKVYPSVNLYKDGLRLETLNGVQASDFLETWIQGQMQNITNWDATLSEAAKTTEQKEVISDNDKEEQGNAKQAGSKTNNSPSYPESDKVGSVESTKDEPSAKEGVPNPEGVSFPLTYKDFTHRVADTRDSWFIQFYSPKSKQTRDIKPAWDQMSRKARGKLNIGQVNCDEQRKLCKKLGISHYPTLKYFASYLQPEYKGLRGTDDLLQFLKRAVDARNPPEISYSDYKKLRNENEDVTLLYLYDSNTSTEDFQAFEKLGVGIVGTADVAKSKDEDLIASLKESILPSLYAVSKEKIVRFPGSSPSELRNHNMLHDWAVKNRQPLVPQINPFNYKDIFSNSIVALAILDPREEQATTSVIKELRAVAVELQDKKAKKDRQEIEELRKKKQLKVDEAKSKHDPDAEERANQIRVELKEREPIKVAWVDAILWERWTKRRYGSYNGNPRIIINSENRHRFWDRDINGDVLVPSRSNIVETLEAVTSKGSRIKATTLPNGIISYFKGPQDHLFSFRNIILMFLACGAFTFWYRKKFSKARGLGSSGSEGLLGKLD